MDSDVETIARRAIDAINDRTLPTRAEELLDLSLVRHDLVQLFPVSKGSRGGSDFVGMILGALPIFDSISKTSLVLATERLFACG
jgi:hypothetical protein